jgi:two-component system sensor histidine kinase HydH
MTARKKIPSTVDEEPRRIDGIVAVSQISRQINASLNLQDTLDAIVNTAARLVPCSLAEIDLWDEERQVLTLQAIRSSPERAYPVGKSFPPGKGYTGWVVQNKRSLWVSDVDARSDLSPDILPGEIPFKAYIGIPLLADNELIGALVLVQDEAGAFDENDLQLLEALAGQAAVAIQNARIHDDLIRHHQELSALYAVAEAINQPLEQHNLLESALESVIRVTRADGAAIRLLDPGGNEAVLAAQRGLFERYVQRYNRVHISQDIIGAVFRSGKATLSNDMWIDARVSPEMHTLLQEVGHRSLALVPLVAQDRVVGVLGIVSAKVSFFNEDDLKLLTALGDQIGMAVDNTRLYTDLAQRTRELEAINMVAAAVNQPGDLDRILEDGLKQALVVTGLEMGAIGLRNMKDNSIMLQCHIGMFPEFAAAHQERLRQKSFVDWPKDLEISALTGQIDTEAEDTPLHWKEAGIRQTVNLPLFAEGQLVGALNLATRRTKPFATEEQSLLLAIAHQLGTAIANTRLRQEALKAERLAAVGRVATGVAHDLRSPLGTILRSAEFLARPEISQETRQKLSRAIVSLARRLIGISQGILDFVQEAKLPLKREPCNLLDFLEDVLTVLQIDFSDQGIEVVKDYHYKQNVVMDADRMAQVVYNIATNARDAMPHGGRFYVATRKTGKHIELRFSDTGPGVSAELSDRIFEPFFSYGKSQGAGLGLAIARRIVEEHGGKIVLDSKVERGATFVVQLPA